MKPHKALSFALTPMKGHNTLTLCEHGIKSDHVGKEDKIRSKTDTLETDFINPIPIYNYYGAGFNK